VSVITESELLVVTGKGGVGRSTIAASIGVAAARAGRSTVICELSEQAVIPTIFGTAPPEAGSELVLREGLSSFTIDPEAALSEWIRSQLGGTLARTLRSSGSFAQLVAAAPGASELVSITKAWELGPGRAWAKDGREHDLVVVDAPASGHGVAMLRAPRTYADIAGGGPIRKQAELVWDLLRDRSRCAIVAATLPSELPIGETIELNGWVGETLDRPLDAVIVNRCASSSFSRSEMARIRSAQKQGTVPAEAVQLAASSTTRWSEEAELTRSLADATGLDPLTVPELPADADALEMTERIAEIISSEWA
jgi:anion-transporting  ArsA/GET3 family ATPase